jgi:hypothetical protein
MQIKINEQRMMKKTRRKKKNKSIKTTQLSPQSDEKSSTPKDASKLKTLHMLEPWIKRDELDVRHLFKLKNLQAIFLLERINGQIIQII